MLTQTLPTYIGIDAGGTSVRLIAGDLPPLEARAADDGGPEPLEALVPRWRALRPERPGEEAVCVCAGITKITRGDMQARWEAALARHFGAGRCLVVPDYVSAFHGAIPGGVGVAVVAGTGSVVYGENAAGEALRAGGRGWEYGDEGSGAHLTAEMVRRTLRTLDGLTEPTSLTEAVCSALETADPAALGQAARLRAAAEGRGFLVPLALERARNGDQEARDLFTGAAGWLAAYARAAVTRLGLADAPEVPVATVGGLWEAGELLTVPFAKVLTRWVPGAYVRAPDAAPVVGSARLAAARFGAGR